MSVGSCCCFPHSLSLCSTFMFCRVVAGCLSRRSLPRCPSPGSHLRHCVADEHQPLQGPGPGRLAQRRAVLPQGEGLGGRGGREGRGGEAVHDGTGSQEGGSGLGRPTPTSPSPAPPPAVLPPIPLVQSAEVEFGRLCTFRGSRGKRRDADAVKAVEAAPSHLASASPLHE